MRRVRSGLELLFWATLLGDVAQTATSLHSGALFRRLQDGSSSHSALFEQLSLVHDAHLAITVVVAVASMVGLVLVARAPEAERLRVRLLASLTTLTVAGDFALVIAQETVGGSAPPSILRLQIGLWLMLLLAVAGGAMLLVICRRVAAAQERPLPAWVSVGVSAQLVWFVVGAASVALWPRFGASAVRQALYAILPLPMLVALWHAARTRALPAATAEVPDGLGAAPLSGRAWPSVASGLATYRGAVLAKLVVLVGSMALFALAVLTNSAGLAKTVAIGAPVVDVVLTLVLIVGLVDYGAVPDETGARTTATLAVISAVFTLCTQLYAGWLLYQLWGASEASDYRALEAAQHRLPVTNAVTQLAALAGLLLLLASFRALAESLELPQVARRTGWVSLAVGVTMLAALLFSGYVVHGLDDVPSSRIIAWGGLLLALAVATLVAYLGILGALLAELRARLGAATSSSTP